MRVGAVLYATCRLCGPIYATPGYVPGIQVPLALCPGCRNQLIFRSLAEDLQGQLAGASGSEEHLQPVPVRTGVK